jgi:hypothetical protein
MQTWMHDMKELDDRPLRELVIPGSHDAGTFVMEHRIDKIPASARRSPFSNN